MKKNYIIDRQATRDGPPEMTPGPPREALLDCEENMKFLDREKASALSSLSREAILDLINADFLEDELLEIVKNLTIQVQATPERAFEIEIPQRAFALWKELRTRLRKTQHIEKRDNRFTLILDGRQFKFDLDHLWTNILGPKVALASLAILANFLEDNILESSD